MNFVYYEQATPEMVEKYRMDEEREMKRNGGYLYNIYIDFGYKFSFGTRAGFRDIFLDDEAECYLRVGSTPGYIGGKHSHSFLLYIHGKKILFTIKQENDAGEYDEENIKLVWIWDKGTKKIEEISSSVLSVIKEAICVYLSTEYSSIDKTKLIFNF